MILSPPRERSGNARILAWFAFAGIWALSLHGETARPARGDGPRVMLCDDYYQLERPDDFSQGVAARPEDRKLTNFYHPDANGIPNGTFVFSRLIADDFTVKTSRAPISDELLRSADAYLLICPIRQEKGGRGALTEKEADRLEAFVAEGGILILVLNNVSGKEDNAFDVAGMNRIAQRFGLRFAAKTTGTLLIPVAKDHPVFSGVRNIVYGNGTIIEHGLSPGTETTVLLESNNPDVPGAVAVRARYQKGAVLALGDSGTLGNAHSLRDETDQAEALRQMLRSLLPEGPMPRYGWRSGLKMRVKLWHQQVISGYPDGLKLLDLPRAKASAAVETEMRDLDRQSADSAAAPAKRAFASVLAEWKTEATLTLAEFDGRAFAASWSERANEPLLCRITPRGETLDAGLGAPSLTPWRWALLRAIIPAPLDPSAKAGDTWSARTMTPLPQAQLQQAPRMREVEARLKFEGHDDYQGKRCLVYSKTETLRMSEIPPQDLVDPAYADYFNSQKIRLTSGGQMVYVKTWIDAQSRLPVKTELRASSGFWWMGDDQPDAFLSSHDGGAIYESGKVTRRIVIFGRVLTAEFTVDETKP